MSYSEEMPVRAHWILDKIIGEYRKDIDPNFTRNLLSSHSIHSFSRGSERFGINETYSGEFVLVILKGGVQKEIKCIWKLSNNDENIMVVEWQEL